MEYLYKYLSTKLIRDFLHPFLVQALCSRWTRTEVYQTTWPIRSDRTPRSVRPLKWPKTSSGNPAVTFEEKCTFTMVSWFYRWAKCPGSTKCPGRTLHIVPQRTHDAIITPLLRQNDVATSFWRNNDVIVASRVRRSGTWQSGSWLGASVVETHTYTLGPIERISTRLLRFDTVWNLQLCHRVSLLRNIKDLP